MRSKLTFQVVGCMVFLVTFVIAAVASAQTRTIRVVTYNIEADIGGVTTPRPGLITPSSGGSVTNGGVLEGIGEENVNGSLAQPIDILALQETTSNSTTVQPIVDGLNTFYSVRGIPARYAMSSYQATSSGGVTSGGGPNALVYNTNTVQLIASVGVGTPTGSGNGEYRQVVRYLFAPAGVTATASNEFYVYVSHYKSGTNSTDLIARTGESGIIRTNSATLPSNARVLYVGDYNVSTSAEVSYQNIVGTALIGIQGIDPFNPTGSTGQDWTLSAPTVFKTFSPTSLHYRDDFQVMSSNVFNGVGGGLACLVNTYHTFGNNGSTPYLGSVNNGFNTSLNGTKLTTNVTGITAAQLYEYLTTASDHLPVVADYTIPIPELAPVASFTGSPTNGTEPLAVTFTDTSTGSITNRFWDFGDGGTTNITTNSVVHTYSAGTFDVTLSVSGPDGASTTNLANYINVLTAFQAWQIQYFGSTNNASAASGADPDGDGQNNMAEFASGTDPTNSMSALQITSVSRQGSDVFVIWTMGDGKTNALQSSAGATGGSYSTNFTDLFIVTNTVGSATNYLDVGGATNVPSRYYRVTLVP